MVRLFGVYRWPSPLAGAGSPATAQERQGGGGASRRLTWTSDAPLIMTTTAFEAGGVVPAKFVGAMGVSLGAQMDAGPSRHPALRFELYAVDTKVDVPQATPQQAADTRKAVMAAIDGHILSKAIIGGRFHQ